MNMTERAAMPRSSSSHCSRSFMKLRAFGKRFPIHRNRTQTSQTLRLPGIAEWLAVCWVTGFLSSGTQRIPRGVLLADLAGSVGRLIVENDDLEICVILRN